MQNDNEPTRAKINDIIEANKKEIKILNMEKLSLIPEKVGIKGSPTYVNKAFRNQKKHEVHLFKESPQNSAKLILDAIKSKLHGNDANS